jgi:predicted Zn-dependent peptidase/LysM repeat protein
MRARCGNGSRRPGFAFRFTLVAALVVGVAAAAVPPASAEPEQKPAAQVAVERFRLRSGLRAVLSVEPSSPTVAACLLLNVGVRSEAPAQDGAAHVMRRMLRAGVTPAQQLPELVESRGGRMETYGFMDRTRLCSVLPSSELELAVWVVSRQLLHGPISREAFEHEKQQALAHHRAWVMDRVYGRGSERLHQLAFQGLFAYERGTLGSFAGLEALQYQAMQRFFVEHHRPNQAVLSLAGDFEASRARALVRKYLADQPAGAAAPAAPVAIMARQTTERYSSIDDAGAKVPALFFGWPIAKLAPEERCALELLAFIVAEGDGSLLNQELMRRTRLARSVSAWFTDHRDPRLFGIQVVASPKSDIVAIRRHVQQVIARLAQQGPTQAELAHGQRKLEADVAFRLASHLERAALLADVELMSGDARRANERTAQCSAVTPAQIRKVVSQRLGLYRRTLVELYPPGWRDPGPAAVMPKYHIVGNGETLIGIAKKHGVGLEALVSLNRLDPKKAIFPGQKLTVPKGRAVPKQRTYTVKKGDTLSGIAKRHKVTVDGITKANRLQRNKPIRPGQVLVIP